MEKENSTKTDFSSPKISCIVPVYNVEKYLNRCIDSILAQTFTDFELILIDDGSPDNSGLICDEYAEKDSRIRVIHKPNGGVSSARNAGLDAARGEFVCFVDSDDWVETNYFDCLYKMIANSKYDVAVCGFVGENRRKPKVLDKENAIINIFSQKGYGGFSQKKIFSLALVNAAPKTRYDEKITYLEDSEFFYRLFKKCSRVYWDNVPLYHYEANEGSVTRQTGITENHRNAYKVLERLIENESNENIRTSIKICYFNFRMVINMLFLLKKNNLSDEENTEMQFCREYSRNFIKENNFSIFKEFSFKKAILILMMVFVPESIMRKMLVIYGQHKRLRLHRGGGKCIVKIFSPCSQLSQSSLLEAA